MSDPTISNQGKKAEKERSGFSSRLGFVLAAAGSAVGLGNIWSYPTEVAENGGAAFVLIYFILTLLLAYPVLVAELLIGRYGQCNPVSALEKLPSNQRWRPMTRLSGLLAVVMICLIFSFYSIVGGWIVGFTLSPLLHLFGMTDVALWLETFAPIRNCLLAWLFVLMTLIVVKGGVKEGIERWSSRLMPVLLLLLLVLIGFIMTQKGAFKGVSHYLVPHFSRINTTLALNALGQAFFSMSIGVGAMMVYGSYLHKESHLPMAAFQVCLVDTAVAFLAGLLIIPAMFVAMELGITIYTPDGQLINSDTLVFQVLPALFNSLGTLGIPVAFAFFSLMSIAALTSSISMLEVPVSCLSERVGITHTKSGIWVCAVVCVIIAVIITWFDPLFKAIIVLTTQYVQPLEGLLFCLFVGWLMGRNQKLNELKQGWPEMENSIFWTIWPWYVRLVCPGLILTLFFIH